MSIVSFALAVVFIIRRFSTSAFRVPKLIGGHFGSEAKVLFSRLLWQCYLAFFFNMLRFVSWVLHGVVTSCDLTVLPLLFLSTFSVGHARWKWLYKNINEFYEGTVYTFFKNIRCVLHSFWLVWNKNFCIKMISFLYYWSWLLLAVSCFPESRILANYLKCLRKNADLYTWWSAVYECGTSWCHTCWTFDYRIHPVPYSI